ncbi:MAG TPA: AIR synthase related protein, partial [Methylomirabilota bacterium]
LEAFDPLSLPVPVDLAATLITLLDCPAIATKAWVYRQYDQQVGINSLVLPGSDAGVVRIRGTRKAVALTTDCNARFVYLNPRVGAAMAVAEAARNLAVTGARPLGLTDCLNFGSPERPEILWQFKEAVAGIAEACRALDIPVVGGNVSFYNETQGQAILPTPVIGMAGLIDEADTRRTQWFEAEGDRIALLGPEAVSLGGSEFLWVIRGLMSGGLAPLDLDQERRVHEACRAAIAAELVRGAHDCAEGGLAVTLAECCISGPRPVGARVSLEDDGRRADLVLFGEGPSRVVVSVPPEGERHFERLMGEFALPWRWIGRVGGEALVVSRGPVTEIAAPLDRMAHAWRAGFERHVA